MGTSDVAGFKILLVWRQIVLVMDERSFGNLFILSQLLLWLNDPTCRFGLRIFAAILLLLLASFLLLLNLVLRLNELIEVGARIISNLQADPLHSLSERTALDVLTRDTVKGRN